MILVDSSVWVDHLRSHDPALSGLLEHRQVLSHPFVIGELALGSLRQRDVILQAMRGLPRAIVASDEEVHALIERRQLFGTGIGYVDAHLLAATLLTTGARLRTRDRRLRAVAQHFDLDARVDS